MAVTMAVLINADAHMVEIIETGVGHIMKFKCPFFRAEFVSFHLMSPRRCYLAEGTYKELLPILEGIWFRGGMFGHWP